MEYDITLDILNTASFGPIIGGNYIPRTIYASYNIKNGYNRKYSDIPLYTKTTYVLKNANLVDCGGYDIIPAFYVYDTIPNLWFNIPILIKDCICSNTFIFNYTNYLESENFHKNYTTFSKQDLINICKDTCFFVGVGI